MESGIFYGDGENYRSNSLGMGEEGQWAQNQKTSCLGEVWDTFKTPMWRFQMGGSTQDSGLQMKDQGWT